VPSAFLSGTETRFLRLNRVQVHRMERTGSAGPGGSRHPGQPQDLSTPVLVGNTLVNIAISGVVTTAQ